MKEFYYLKMTKVESEEVSTYISEEDFQIESEGVIQLSVERGDEDEEGTLILENGERALYKTDLRIHTPLSSDVKGEIYNKNNFLIASEDVLAIYQEKDYYILKGLLPSEKKPVYRFCKIEKSVIQEYLA